MWITKIIGVLAQLCVIILAILLVYQFSSKQIYDGRIDSIERDLTAKIDDNKKYLNDKIIVQQDNVNRYIQLREDRANLFAQRLDTLYDLYKKDPAPVDNASLPKPIDPVVEHPIDKNFTYLEQRINKVDEKADTNNNKLESRLNILEQRVSNHTSNRSESVKVIQTNLQTVNNGKME